MYVDKIGRCHFYEYEKCHEMDLNLKNAIKKRISNVDDLVDCYRFVIHCGG